MKFDHIAISCETLDSGVQAIEAALGVPLEPGGKHALMGTHNRLLSLGGEEYLEVIAIDPDAPPPGRPRWFDLDNFSGAPRLTNWVCRTDSLDSAISGAPIGVGEAHDMERGAYRWRMSIPANGKLPHDGAFPGLVEWQSDHPARLLPDRGCRLVQLILGHPDADAVRVSLEKLGDPRIVVEEAAAPSLRAEISTRNGTMTLS